MNVGSWPIVARRVVSAHALRKPLSNDRFWPILPQLLTLRRRLIGPEVFGRELLGAAQPFRSQID